MFDSPLALIALLAILVLVSYLLLGRRDAARGRSRAPHFRRRSPWRTRAPVLLMAGAIVFLALAFTQFRFLRDEGSAGTVMLVLDVSESMSRDDVEPTRLEAAKAAVRVFLEQLPAELQVGLVSFADRADVLVPPSAERDDVVGSLDELPRGEGTLIGDGLAAALDALEAEWERAGERPAAVVLLSDGRDTGSLVSPDDAAGRAVGIEVRVHTVVLGRVDPTGEGGANVELLQRIADRTGGEAFTADTAGGLIDVYENLQAQITTELAISDNGALFVGIAAVFALAATAMVLLALRSGY